MPLVEFNRRSRNSTLASMAVRRKISSPRGPRQGRFQAYFEADRQGRRKFDHRGRRLGLRAPNSGNPSSPFPRPGRWPYAWHAWVVR